jgi:uncharacterized protein (UPF0297 family)
MELIAAAEGLINNINGFAFMMGSLVSLVIYNECRKCIQEIERKEMLDSFLKH